MNKNGTPENLVPATPGVSGNPGGRPKSKPITDALRHLVLSAKVIKRDGKAFEVELPKEPRAVDYLAQGILEDALNRDATARTLLLDRTEGKVAQPLSGSDDEPPIQIEAPITAKEVARVLGNIVMNAEYDRQEKEEAEKAKDVAT